MRRSLSSRLLLCNCFSNLSNLNCTSRRASTRRSGCCLGVRTEVGCDFAFSFGDGLDQQPHVLVSILDTIERALRGTVQGFLAIENYGARMRLIRTPVRSYPTSRKPQRQKLIDQCITIVG